MELMDFRALHTEMMFKTMKIPEKEHIEYVWRESPEGISTEKRLGKGITA